MSCDNGKRTFQLGSGGEGAGGREANLYIHLGEGSPKIYGCNKGDRDMKI